MGFEGILKLTEAFGTSITACALKFVESELRPCMLLKWGADGRLQWKRFSQSLYEARLSLAIQKGSQFNHFIPGSPTDQIHSGSKSQRDKFLRAGSTIRSWFPNARDFQNDILVEEAFSLGEFGSLTILYTDKNKLSF